MKYFVGYKKILICWSIWFLAVQTTQLETADSAVMNHIRMIQMSDNNSFNEEDEDVDIFTSRRPNMHEIRQEKCCEVTTNCLRICQLLAFVFLVLMMIFGVTTKVKMSHKEIKPWHAYAAGGFTAFLFLFCVGLGFWYHKKRIAAARNADDIENLIVEERR